MLNTSLLKALLIVLALTVSAAAQAQIKYTFESAAPLTATGEYTAETRVTGHFILDAQYPPNTTLYLFLSGAPLPPDTIRVNTSAWQFTDGVDTFSAATVDQDSIVLVGTDDNGIPALLVFLGQVGINPAEVGEPIASIQMIIGLSDETPVHQVFAARFNCNAVTDDLCTGTDDSISELAILSEESNGITTSAVPIPSLSALGLALMALSLAWMGMRAMRNT